MSHSHAYSVLNVGGITRGETSWLGAGVALAFGSFAWLFLSGHRRSARMSAGLAGAMLERLGEIRLEQKVAGLLAQAKARAQEGKLKDPAAGEFDFVDMWRS